MKGVQFDSLAARRQRDAGGEGLQPARGRRARLPRHHRHRRQAEAPDLELVDELADECFMPLTVGGGVRTSKTFAACFGRRRQGRRSNTAAVETPELIARSVGPISASQCVVVSIDARARPTAAIEVYARPASQPTGRDPVDVARDGRALGRRRDPPDVDRPATATMDGYDVETRPTWWPTAVRIPVIASGGAGTYEHMAEVLARRRRRRRSPRRACSTSRSRRRWKRSTT